MLEMVIVRKRGGVIGWGGMGRGGESGCGAGRGNRNRNQKVVVVGGKGGK